VTNPDVNEADVDDSTQTRICKNCAASKPLQDYAVRNASTGTRRGVCRACIAAQARARFIPKRPPVPEGLKRCAGCKRNLPKENFGKCSAASDGLYFRCRPCARAKAREQHAENREKNNAKARAWRAANKELSKRLVADWNSRNADRIKEKRRERATRNPEAIRLARERFRKANPGYNAAWAAANKDKVAEATKRYRIRNASMLRESMNYRRALKVSAEAKRVDLDSLWDGFCGICGEALSADVKWPHSDSPSVDHIIPISKGGSHTQENLQWAHLGCNIRKSDKVE
jgi:5-methylcytosine-specific restriction endonuclease McrA